MQVRPYVFCCFKVTFTKIYDTYTQTNNESKTFRTRENNPLLSGDRRNDGDCDGDTIVPLPINVDDAAGGWHVDVKLLDSCTDDTASLCGPSVVLSSVTTPRTSARNGEERKH